MLVDALNAAALTRRGLWMALLYASTSRPLLAADDATAAACGRATGSDGADIVYDAAGYLSSAEYTRLVRIIRLGEEQTGVRIRVLTRTRLSDEWTFDPPAVRCQLGIAAGDRDNTVLLVGDRGIAGALEAGSTFLSFQQVGTNVRLSLPDVWFARLKQEYGRRSFIEKFGEGASLIVAVELMLTCLRNEEGYCTAVPPASTYF